MILQIDHKGELVLFEGVKIELARGIAEVATVLRLRRESFICSPTIDFPEESTDDQEVIKFCRGLRS